jgi:predicted transcriptional regulator
MIAEYRERWSVPDDGPLLGAPPAADESQAADRDALDQQLKRLRRLTARTNKARP